MRGFLPIIIYTICSIWFIPITQGQSVSSPTLTATTATGTITACEGTASETPSIQEFSAYGNYLSTAPVVTAPSGFEVSLSLKSNYGNSVVLPTVATSTGGQVHNQVVYVRASASAPAGQISGNVTITANGATSLSVVVKAIVNPPVTVNNIPNQTVANGGTTTAVNFTGTGSTFTWTNNTPGIGLAASGSGNIPSFIAVNNTGSPVTATITVAPQPSSFAYINNVNDNTVSVINTSLNKVVATIPVGTSPFGIAVSPDGNLVYIVNYGSSNISVVSTSTNKVISTMPTNGIPGGICISSDGKTIYLSIPEKNLITVIDAVSNAVIATVQVGVDPDGICISPDGSMVYVENAGSSSVSVVSTATNSLITSISTGLQTIPSAIAISPDGTRVYTANGSGGASVISTASNTLIASIISTNNFAFVCVSPDNSKIYIGDIGTNNIMVYNASNYQLLKSIPVSNSPSSMSLSLDGSSLYAVNALSNTVSVINTISNTVTSIIPVGNYPDSYGQFVSPVIGCPGPPVTFTITVNNAITGTISAAINDIAAMNTTYGTSSAPVSFTFSGSNLSAGVLVTAPTGFEVSADGNNFSATTTIGTAGAALSAVVYIRLAAATPVGNYTGDVTLSSSNAANLLISVENSTVIPAPLIITANNQSKLQGNVNPALTIDYTGFENNENADVLSPKPIVNTTATTISPPGEYPIIVSGASANNYAITYVNGTLTITPLNTSAQLIIPNTFTPNGDGINDTWQIQNIENYPNCTVYVFNRYGQKVLSSIGYGVAWDGTYRGSPLPSGTYYYLIDTKTNKKLLSGWIAIVR